MGIKDWFKDYRKGKRIRLRFGWFGEKGMKKPMPKDKKITIKEIMKRIRKE